MARFRSPGLGMIWTASFLYFTFLSFLGSTRCLKADTGYLFGSMESRVLSPIYRIGGILAGATPLGLGWF
jgi:hypothetical protein